MESQVSIYVAGSAPAGEDAPHYRHTKEDYVPRKKSPGSKSSFVRSLPSTMPAKEVIEKAKEMGITLSEKYVWNIRSAAKAKSGGRRGARGESARSGASTPAAKTPTARRGRPPGRPPGRPSGGGAEKADSEQQFVRMVLDIGLVRAESLLGRLRDDAGSFVSGR